MFSLFVFIFLSVVTAQTPALNPTPEPKAQVAVQTKEEQTPGQQTEISAPKATLIAVGVASFFVAAGWVAVHALTIKRERETRAHADRKDKEDRRTDLLSTLQHWHHTFVVVTDPAESKKLYYFEGGMKELAAAAVKFRGCVTDKDTFDRLNFQMSEMNPETLDTNGANKRRETICGAIRAFTEFVRNA